jgi:hypothetical protein
MVSIALPLIVGLTAYFLGWNDGRVSAAPRSCVSGPLWLFRKATASMSLETRCKPFLYRWIIGCLTPKRVITLTMRRCALIIQVQPRTLARGEHIEQLGGQLV